MTFINGLLALGAFAFAIPLVIHLLFRSRYRTVQWGAMHLLSGVVQVNRRRMQILNLVLLLLRCLIPVVLAFCLARPLLTGFQSLPGDAPETLVIAVDDSLSLAMKAEGGQSREAIARDAIDRLIDECSRSDEVMIVRGSRPGEIAASLSKVEARRRAKQLEFVSGTADLASLVDSGLRATKQANHPGQQIVVVSDFQSRLVSDSTLKSLTEMGRVLNEFESSPEISLLDVGINGVGGNGTGGISNASVDSIVLESAAAVVGRTARFTARIKNHSDEAIENVRLVWTVDGRKSRPKRVSIPARSSTTTPMSTKFDDSGDVNVSVSIEHSDALAADNHRDFVVDVIDAIEVLIVDGKPSSQPLAGQSDFLSLALSPFAFGGQDLPDAVRSRTVRQQKIADELEEQRVDVVILAGVQLVTEQQRRLLGQFVSEGGALILFDHPTIDAESYGKTWGTNENPWSMPAIVGQYVNVRDDQSESAKIAPDIITYAPWQILGDPSDNLYGDVEVNGYRRLKVDSVSEPSSEREMEIASVLLRLSTGDPAVVMAGRGQGTVVQFAIAADAEETTLPLRLVFLPMIQQLTLDLAGRAKAMNVGVGESLVVPVTELLSKRKSLGQMPSKRLPVSELKDLDASYSLTIPGQAERSIDLSTQPVQKSPVLISGPTPRAGVYRFGISYFDDDDSSKRKSSRSLRAAQMPTAESDPRRVDAERLGIAADRIDAEVFEQVAELIDAQKTNRYGREVWRYLLFALLALMIGELFVQQVLGSPWRRKSDKVLGNKASPLFASEAS